MQAKVKLINVGMWAAYLGEPRRLGDARLGLAPIWLSGLTGESIESASPCTWAVITLCAVFYNEKTWPYTLQDVIILNVTITLML